MTGRRGGHRLVRNLLGAALSFAVLQGIASCSRSSNRDDEPNGRQENLAAFLEIPTPEDAASLSSQRIKDEQEAILKCMQRKGLSYTVFVPEIRASDFADQVPFTVSTSGEAQGAGFGVTLPMGHPSNNEPHHSPNEDYMASLDPPDLVAYQTALYGHPLADQESVDSEDPAGTGCLHEGYRAAAPTGLPPPELWSKYRNLLVIINDHVLAAPAIVEADRSYRVCMAGSDFPDIPSPGSVLEALVFRWHSLAPDVPIERALAEMPGSKELATIQEYEVALSEAHAVCIGAWSDEYKMTRRSVELQLVRENADWLIGLQCYVLSTR